VQVPTILNRIDDAEVPTLIGYALLITGVVMGVRLLWMLVVPAVFPSRTSRAERIAIGWSGMRGGVSLAAALAIPREDFPHRDLVIFVAYAVIVITLVVPGLTLAPLLRRLGMVETEDDRRADAEARLRVTEAALERLEELAEDAPEHLVQRMRDRYGSRLERLQGRVEGDHDEEGQSDVAVAGRLLAGMIGAEREVLKEMRSESAFPAELLKELEHELDLEESRLQARIRL
jgi:CPA1 family monovalent cation:H+ antiporter